MNAAPAQPPPTISRQIVIEVIAAVLGAVASAMFGGVLAAVSLSALVPVVIALAGVVLLLIFSKWPQVLRLGIAVVVGIAAGLMIGPLLDPDTPQPPSVAPTSPAPAQAAVQITAPGGEVQCADRETPHCVFEVGGTVSGYDPSAHRLYVFVKPTNPSGGGWYPQVQPADVDGDQWRQTQSQIGSPIAPAKAGDRLALRAAVLRRDATHNGIRLAEWPPGEALPQVEDIDGYVAISEQIALTVRR